MLGTLHLQILAKQVISHWWLAFQHPAMAGTTEVGIERLILIQYIHICQGKSSAVHSGQLKIYLAWHLKHRRLLPQAKISHHILETKITLKNSWLYQSAVCCSPGCRSQKSLPKISVAAVGLGAYFMHNQCKSHKQTFVLSIDIHEHLQRYVEKILKRTIRTLSQSCSLDVN